MMRAECIMYNVVLIGVVFDKRLSPNNKNLVAANPHPIPCDENINNATINVRLPSFCKFDVLNIFKRTSMNNTNDTNDTIICAILLKSDILTESGVCNRVFYLVNRVFLEQKNV